MELEARMFKAYAKGDEKNSVKDHTGPFVTSPVSHQSLSGYDYDEDQMRRGIQDRKAAFQQI